MNAPSPTTTMTGLCGRASLAPSAAPGPHPRPDAELDPKYRSGDSKLQYSGNSVYSLMTMQRGSLARSIQWLTHAGSSGALRAAASSAVFHADVKVARSSAIQRLRDATVSAANKGSRPHWMTLQSALSATWLGIQGTSLSITSIASAFGTKRAGLNPRFMGW